MQRDENGLPRPAGMKEGVRIYFTGFAMGAADIVPGVSGGTMAFIMGIYSDLIHSIKAFGVKALLMVIERKFSELFKFLPLKFLTLLGAGILTAIISLSSFIAYLLEYQTTYVFSFFGGLIVASIVAVAFKIDWSPAAFLACAVTAVAAFFLVGLHPGESAQHDPLTLFVSGMIAICAMILPGISGSFILLVLGQYEFILNAVHSRDLVSVISVAAGCGVGIMAFARVLSWLLGRAYTGTVAALTGFMIGSLRLIWDKALAGAQSIEPFGVWGQGGALGLFFAGLFIVSLLDHLQTRSNPLFRMFARAQTAKGALTA